MNTICLLYLLENDKDYSYKKGINCKQNAVSSFFYYVYSELR